MNFKDKIQDSIRKINKSRLIINQEIDKFGSHNSYLQILNKLDAVEIILKDSERNTVEGTNKSNKETKENFLVLFDTVDKVYDYINQNLVE